jgi:uncharacterized membrane protein
MTLLVGVLLGLVALVGYGLANYFGAIASKKAGWFESATVSRAVSFLVLLVVFLALLSNQPITLVQALLLIVAGVLSNIGLLFFFKAMNVGDLSIVAPIGSTDSAIAVVLVLIFLKTPASYLQKLFVFLTIIGTILVSFKYKDLRRLNFRKFVAGSEYAALSAVFWGVDIFIEIVLINQLGWLIPAFFVYLVMLVCNLIYSVVSSTKFVRIRKAIVPSLVAGLTAAVATVAFN